MNLQNCLTIFAFWKRNIASRQQAGLKYPLGWLPPAYSFAIKISTKIWFDLLAFTTHTGARLRPGINLIDKDSVGIFLALENRSHSRKRAPTQQTFPRIQNQSRRMARQPHQQQLGLATCTGLPTNNIALWSCAQIFIFLQDA